MSETRGGTPEYIDRQIGPVTVLFGYQNGKYPDGNSMLIEGRDETVIVDPSLGVIPRKERLPAIDRVLHSHVHEDHVAANYLFESIPWHAHEEDLLGLKSLDGLMSMYGVPEPANTAFKKDIEEKFNYVSQPGAKAFRDGDQFDLGGVRINVIHTPGHTRGHCCFVIDWDGSEDRLVYLGDIELTSFGPYYGDAWSDLDAFQDSLAKLDELDARWWLTFHHKGLYESRESFLVDLEKFTSVIAKREARLLEFLKAPHSLEDIVKHRFVFRPGDEGVFVDNVERRSMERHLRQLLDAGHITESSDGFYQAVSGAP
jgi:glyoxylase-like metal-dependent hydrolase (beta-lactamase superfamily II)